MDTHKSVSLTPEGREMMVRVVVDFGLSKAAAARQFNTTPKTVAKWIERFEADGADGLCDRSSRPHSSPSQAAPVACAGSVRNLVRGAGCPSGSDQVDGGSEFMAAFEDHCRTNGLELVALPPKWPDLKGAVERAQSSWRHEFYASYDLPNRVDRLRLSTPSPTSSILQAPPGSWRQNPRRVSPISQLRDQVVSDVLNPDKPLRLSRFDTTFSATRFGPP